MKKIAPSILSADFTRLAKEIKAVEEAKADYIHIDVMDGHFVPNITIGPFIVEAARRVTRLPLDVHLMIENPETYIPSFVRAGSDIITVQVESTRHLHRAIQSIKEHGIRAGVTLNPATPVDHLEGIIDDVDLVLVMSVNPGFGGQEFIPFSLKKLKAVRKMLDARHSTAELEIDGGIKVSNIGEASKAKKTIRAMRKEIAGAQRHKGTRKKRP
jgi:ribulose-phosphate 3-epimerase